MLDNADWHKTASLNWHQIKPVDLAPYSPDFNPIESLWQHLQSQAMAGYLTNDGEALTEKLLDSLQSPLDKPEIIRSVRSTPTFNRQ